MSSKNESNVQAIWRDADGNLRCLGNNCPLSECDVKCPIYKNTLAVELLKKHEYSKVIQEYRSILAENPDYYDAWNNSAVAYGSEGNFSKAYECYLKAHEISSEKPSPVYGLALACKDLKRYDECIKWCDAFYDMTRNRELMQVRALAESAITGKQIKIIDNDVPEYREEFDKDIKALLNRDDLHTREDISKAEYNKGIALYMEGSQNKDESLIHRAYDIMGNLAKEFEYIPAIFWMGNFAESAGSDFESASYWFKKGASLGDGQCAKNYADLLMQYIDNPDLNEIMHYYKLAADSGVADAAFVCGEFARKNNDLKAALDYYNKAVDGGFKQAQIRIDQIKAK